MDVIFKLESHNAFIMAIEEIMHNLHSTNAEDGLEVESNIINAAKDDLRNLILKCDFEIDHLAKQMESNVWDQQRVEHFISLLKAKKTDAFRKLIVHHNSSYSDTATEFDWFLKLVIGTSEYKKLRYPVLQLMLKTINSSGDQKQKLYEITKEVLNKLIQTLQNEIKDDNN